MNHIRRRYAFIETDRRLPTHLARARDGEPGDFSLCGETGDWLTVSIPAGDTGGLCGCCQVEFERLEKERAAV